MKVAVIGAGAVGGLLASHLVRSKTEVVLVDVVKDVLNSAMEKGLSVSGPAAAKTFGNFSAKPANAVSNISDAGDVDVVFVCVKTAALDAVAKSLSASWKRGTTLVSFQNGIDSEEILAKVAGRDSTLRVVVNYAGHILQPASYSFNWFNPPNFIGALSEAGNSKAKSVATLLSEANLTTVVAKDIKAKAFEKTALNSTLCPICTITNLTMDEAMKCAETRKLAADILVEARAVGNKMGFEFDHSIEDWLGYLSKGGGHKTSMWEDMNAGRPTEINFMNGKICEHGAKFGVPTPFNEAMKLSILGMEKGRGR